MPPNDDPRDRPPQPMPPAPQTPPLLPLPGAGGPDRDRSRPAAPSHAAALFGEVAAAHRSYLAIQADLHSAFLRLCPAALAQDDAQPAFRPKAQAAPESVAKPSPDRKDQGRADGSRASLATADAGSDHGAASLPVSAPTETSRSLDGGKTPSARASAKRAFSRDDLDLFCASDAFGCFGAGFERAAAHQRTPCFPDRERLISSAPVFDPTGGPWGRGYLRVEAIAPDSGDVTAEGVSASSPFLLRAARQALAFGVAAPGFTVGRDSWRFEPAPETPESNDAADRTADRLQYVVCEVFIEDIHEGDSLVAHADAVCSADGVELFRRRVAVALTPDWPLPYRPDAAPQSAPRHVGPSGKARGDEYAMMVCAWGKPSDAFGQLGAPYDGPRRSLRLPGPPYHFVSRILSVDCEIGVPTMGGAVVAEYDIPADAWYFDDPRGAVMPFPVLMEAALQPCGWLSCYMGFLNEISGEALFRNLDGKNVRCFGAVTAQSGRLTTRARLDRYAKAGGSTIVFYAIEVRDKDRLIMTLDAAFGFFSPEALAKQAGLFPPPEQEDPSDASTLPSISFAELATGEGTPLPCGRIRMIDAISGYWPEGGKAGLGRIRGEQRVDPRAWYFKAHFFQDPVQPGSLGIEALIQLLQAFVRLRGLAASIPRPVFGPVGVEHPLAWRFRGQITPEHRHVVTRLDITEIKPHADGGLIIGAEGGVWVDGLPIYWLDGLSLRIASDAGEAPR